MGRTRRHGGLKPRPCWCAHLATLSRQQTTGTQVCDSGSWSNSGRGHVCQEHASQLQGGHLSIPKTQR
eukprot:scaffold222498_cov18-Tisochrysis_lutea.AAC.1